MNINWNEVHPGEIILHGKKPAVFIGLVDIHNTAIDIQYVKDGKQKIVLSSECIPKRLLESKEEH